MFEEQRRRAAAAAAVAAGGWLARDLLPGFSGSLSPAGHWAALLWRGCMPASGGQPSCNAPRGPRCPAAHVANVAFTRLCSMAAWMGSASAARCAGMGISNTSPLPTPSCSEACTMAAALRRRGGSHSGLGAAQQCVWAHASGGRGAAASVFVAVCRSVNRSVFPLQPCGDVDASASPTAAYACRRPTPSGTITSQDHDRFKGCLGEQNRGSRHGKPLESRSELGRR